MIQIERDDVHAFKEQWKDVAKRYNPEIITLSIAPRPPEGTIARIDFKVDISKCKHPKTGMKPQFYVHKPNETEESRCSCLEGHMLILPGFPATSPRVSFDGEKVLKHINVFLSGTMCIGKQIGAVLQIIFDNIFRACIYDPDPSVANYSSPAYNGCIDWQKSKESSGEFPIINPGLLFERKLRVLPAPVIGKDATPSSAVPSSGRNTPSVANGNGRSLPPIRKN